MVTFNIKMRGPDQTSERVNLDITDEEAPLIKVYNHIFFILCTYITAILERRRTRDKEGDNAPNDSKASALLDSQK